MSTLKSKWSKILILLPFIKTETKKLLLFLICYSILGFSLPYLIKLLPESYKDDSLYFIVLSAYFIFVIIDYIVRSQYFVFLDRLAIRICTHLRGNLYQRWIMHEPDKSDSTKELGQGELNARIMDDVQTIVKVIESGLFGTILDMIFVFSSLISFIIIDFKGGLLIVVSLLLLVFILLKGSRSIRKMSFDQQKASAAVTRSIATISKSFADLFFLNHNGFLSNLSNSKFSIFLKTQLKVNFAEALFFSCTESFYPIILIVILVVFPFFGIADIAILIALLDLLQRSISPIKGVAGQIVNLQKGLAGIDRLSDFSKHLSSLSCEVYESKKINVSRLKVDDISFSYKGEDNSTSFYLGPISFEYPIGKLIGIVGTSGGGKTTLLNLLSGNLVHSDGVIQLIENESLLVDSKKDHLDYKSHVSIISQDTHLFSETLGFNISFSKEISLELIQFYKDVQDKIPYLKKWGLKLEDIVKVNVLSEGQRQLVTALRALYFKRPLVLFDEIASGMDSELDASLRNAILLNRKYSLSMIIAHRVETLFFADVIFVMSDGKIQDRGSHKELLASSDAYRTIVDELNVH